MKILRPLFLLALMFMVSVTTLYAAGLVPSWGDSRIPYGYHFSQLRGDLSPSGLAGIDERPAYLNRWEAYFNESLVSKRTLNYLDKYDVYNIMETNEGDDFSNRRGYGLLPQKEDVIKRFVQLANGNPDYVWNIVKNYNSVTQKGFYLLNYFPYISMNHLVELSGGSFDRLETRVQDDPGKINGTVYYNVTPWPKIASAVYDGKEARITFTTYGLTDLHRPKVTLTNGTDKVEKDYGYTSKHIFDGTWTFSADEIERLGPPEQIKVIVEDGFGRTAEAPLQVLTQPLLPQNQQPGASDQSTPPQQQQPSPPQQQQPTPQQPPTPSQPPAPQPSPKPSPSPSEPPMGAYDISLTYDWQAYLAQGKGYPKEGQVYTVTLIARSTNPYPGLVEITFDGVADPKANPDHAQIDVHRKWTITMPAAKVDRDGNVIEPAEKRISVQYKIHRYMLKYPYDYQVSARIKPVPPPPDSEELGMLENSDPRNDGFQFVEKIPGLRLVQ